MEQSDLLRHACNAPSRLGIKYLVVGSQATIVCGEPRFTNDIDIVVDLEESRLAGFLAAFPESDYYVSRTAARQAVRERRMFIIIHPTSGLKIDVVIPKDTVYDRRRFDRGRSIQLADNFAAVFAAPEDVILKKLEIHKLGGSERHVRDIVGVLKISAEKVDRDYIAKHAARLGVADLWQAILGRVDGSDAAD